jgi:hypothetical protein
MKPTKTIQWTCTASPDWKWVSGAAPHTGVPVRDDGVRQGVIALSANKDYWYPCITLGLDGGVGGNAFLRYYEDNGKPMVQAMTVAQGQWIAEAVPDPIVSQTNTRGVSTFACSCYLDFQVCQWPWTQASPRKTPLASHASGIQNACLLRVRMIGRL